MPPVVVRYIIPAAWIIAEIALLAALAAIQDRRAKPPGPRLEQP